MCIRDRSGGAGGGSSATTGPAPAASTSFEDALRPGDPRGGDRQDPQLHLVGDAEVWRGRLDLTPLRGGMGLGGAAWFHRPVEVASGFQCDFGFTIEPPPEGAPVWDEARGAWAPPRGADGLAFVLQLDDARTAALGASGVQLGHGGLTSVLAVQLCTCLLYTSPSPRDRTRSRMPSSA